MPKTRRKRTSPKEQYRLLMVCRSSGLSDQQWCMENGIAPSTFYNWGCRLRKKGINDLPEPCHSGEFRPIPVQDVIKLEVIPEKPFESVTQGFKHMPSAPSIEITLGDATLRIANDASPVLLSQILRCLGGASC